MELEPGRGLRGLAMVAVLGRILGCTTVVGSVLALTALSAACGNSRPDMEQSEPYYLEGPPGFIKQAAWVGEMVAGSTPGGFGFAGEQTDWPRGCSTCRRATTTPRQVALSRATRCRRSRAGREARTGMWTAILSMSPIPRGCAVAG